MDFRMRKYLDLYHDNPQLFMRKVKNRLYRINPWRTRPFTLQDMIRVPAGWKVGPPGYIGIGTSKAGTTWWHQLVLEHPQVTQNRLGSKELEYFIHFLYTGLNRQAIETYRQAFAAPEGSICGEFTPGYLRTPLVAEYIHEAAPDAKLIAILRNPVDQMRSGVNQMMRGARYYGLGGTRQRVFLETTAFPNAITYNLVAPAFQQYLRLFDRSQLLVLQYEKCVADPRAEIRRTYEFLKIDPEFIPPSLRRSINRVDYVVPPIPEDHRKRFVDFYRMDVRATAELFPEIDLSLWPEFHQV